MKTGAEDGERGDSMLGDLEEEDGSGGMYISSSPMGIGGWYTWRLPCFPGTQIGRNEGRTPIP